MNKGRTLSVHVARNVTVSVFYFYKQKTQSKVNKFCEISKHLHEQIMLQKTFLKIYHNFVPYPDISTVSVNATTSDLSFVSVKSPIPMSATPLLTSAIIPFHDPSTDLEPNESVSWSTVLLEVSGYNMGVKYTYDLRYKNFHISRYEFLVYMNLCET